MNSADSQPNLRSQTITAVAIAIGCTLWAVLLTNLLASTSSLSLSPSLESDSPLPLNQSVMYEQFEPGNLYETHFESPYTEYRFQPRKIHLSPSSDIDPESGSFNATVSFTINANLTGGSVATAAAAARRNPKSFPRAALVTTVTYGRGDTQEGSIVIHYDDDDDGNDDHDHDHDQPTIHPDYTVLRFNYSNPESGEDYRSELIHHVLLRDLKAGRELYWYRIRVDSKGATPRTALVLDSDRDEDPDEGGFSSSLRGTKTKDPADEDATPGSTRREWKVEGKTPVYEFVTPPLYGQPTAIALVGDLGQTKNSTRTMARILGAARGSNRYHRNDGNDENDNENDDRRVTNLFIAGDLSYSDGDPHRWDSWLDLAEPLLREIPFASVPGNHEIECDKRTRRTFVPYESYFRNPNRIADPIMVPPSEDYVRTHYCTTPSEFLEGHYDYGNAYYSYRQGLVHAIFLNSYTSLEEGSRQRKWLEETALPSVDRDLTPWLVVVFHTPLYTTFLNHVHELNPTVMKESGLREVFQKHGVNLVVSGHDHAYLRTKALKPDGSVALDGAAPIFWTLGAGGNREGHSRYINPFWPEKWVAKRDNDEYGFGVLFAPNRTHAHLQWMRDDDNGDDDGDNDAASTSTSSVVMRDSVWIENYYYYRTTDSSFGSKTTSAHDSWMARIATDASASMARH